MKQMYGSALRCNGKAFASPGKTSRAINNTVIVFCSMTLFGLLLTGCKKEDIKPGSEDLQSISNSSASAEANIVDSYNLQWKTTWELQQARAATAKYRNIDNALRDGYADIAVDVEGMGHHFMNTALVDDVFDIRHPEILVYNKNDDGTQVLVAVEYAVPLTSPMPEGFTGSNDVWNGTSGFPFWLLHAWVWAYNPDGVFNWTNPDVHLH